MRNTENAQGHSLEIKSGVNRRVYKLFGNGIEIMGVIKAFEWRIKFENEDLNVNLFF